MLALDSTTRGEYDAAGSASAKAAAVISALGSTPAVKIYDGSATEKGSGTMSAPWATESAGAITVGELASFSVTGAGTPDGSWYLRFENAGRWLRGSFGLAGSGQDFVSTIDAWVVGHTARIGTAIINAPSNTAPSLVGAPSSLSFLYGTGGTHDFSDYVVDAEGGPFVYSLVGTAYSGISIDPSSGVLTVSAAAAAATRNLTIRVTDPSGLTSDWPCAVTISAALYRWHPGHYMHLPNVYNASQAEIDTHLGYITALANEACIKGVAVELTWKEIEPTAGSYNWNRPDQYMAHVKSLQATRAANNLPPLRLMFAVHERRFNTATLNTTLLPADLYTNPIYEGGAFLAGVSGSSPSSQPKLYVAAVMDRYINIYKKLVDRYDGEPLFEMLYTKESTLSPGISADWPAGYSHAAMHVQWRRFLSAIGPYRTYCNIAWNANYLGGTTGIPDMETSIDTALAAKIGIGGPDIYSDDGTNSPGPTQAEEIYLGRTGSTPHDYRGELGMFHQEDEAGMNGGQADQTIDQVYTWAVNTLHCTHIWWRRGTLWAGTVLPYLRTHQNLVTTAPSMYGGQINTN